MELIELGNIAKAHKNKLNRREKLNVAGATAVGAAGGILYPAAVGFGLEFHPAARGKLGRKALNAFDATGELLSKIPPKNAIASKLAACGAAIVGIHRNRQIKNSKR